MKDIIALGDKSIRDSIEVSNQCDQSMQQIMSEINTLKVDCKMLK